MFLFPWNPPKKQKNIRPLIKSEKLSFKDCFPPSPERSTETNLSSVVVKGHKSSAVYCFPLRSSSTGLKVSAESQAEQVWLGDDLHLHRISAAPPGGVGRLTLLLHGHTITACKAIPAHSLGNCQLSGCSDSWRVSATVSLCGAPEAVTWRPDVLNDKMPSAYDEFWDATNSEHEYI